MWCRTLKTQCVITEGTPVISLPDLKFGRFSTSGRTAAVSRLRESLIGRRVQTRLWTCLGGQQELGVRRPEFWVVKRQSPEAPGCTGDRPIHRRTKPATLLWPVPPPGQTVPLATQGPGWEEEENTMRKGHISKKSRCQGIPMAYDQTEV